jgi:hypothetical protein
MSGNTNPNVVTDGLVLCLDAGNDESYANSGVIPPKSESISGLFIDDTSPPTHTSYYTILGDDGLYINSTAPINDWLGSFQSTVATTGYYTVVFEHQADDGSSSFKIQNNGVNAGAYTATITTTTTKQIHTETNNITSTGTSKMYIARSGGTGNITISNFRFYKSDSSGNSLVWHDLGSSITGTLTNGPTFSSSNKGFIDFDGVNDYITKSSFVFGNNTARTISLWMNLNDVTNFSVPLVLSANANNYKWQYFHVQDAKVWWMFGDNSGYNERGYSDAILTTGDWYNVAITMDITRSAGDTAKVYSNGVSKGITYQNNDRNSIYNASDMNLHIGAAHYGSGWDYEMEGSISNVVIYDRALSATEVLQNYNAHKARYGL